MNRLVIVAVREYLETVRTKAFVIAILMTPILMLAAFLIPKWAEGAKPEQRLLAVADLTGEIGSDVVLRLVRRTMPGDPTTPLYRVETVDVGQGDPAARSARLDEQRGALAARMRDGRLFGYLVIRPSALDRTSTAGASEWQSANLLDVKVMEDVRADLVETVNARVIEASHVPKEAAAILTSRPPLDVRNPLAGGEAGSIAATFMPMVFLLLLFFTILGSSQALLTSTLEEKANRVIEVLLSSVSPFQLMAGKIAGTCAVGLTIMAIWATGGLSALAANGIRVVSGGQVLLCLAYYLLGFLLVASLMVAAGSACNTLKEAQSLLQPITFLLTMPLLAWIAVAKAPNGTFAVVLSFIPLFTPFLMMMRVGTTTPPPPLEVAASLAVLALSAFLAMRLAARVFRVGVLLYGKPPSLREIVRWARVRG